MLNIAYLVWSMCPLAEAKVISFVVQYIHTPVKYIYFTFILFSFEFVKITFVKHISSNIAQV